MIVAMEMTDPRILDFHPHGSCDSCGRSGLADHREQLHIHSLAGSRDCYLSREFGMACNGLFLDASSEDRYQCERDRFSDREIRGFVI